MRSVVGVRLLVNAQAKGSSRFKAGGFAAKAAEKELCVSQCERVVRMMLMPRPSCHLAVDHTR
ncbi:MAG TPA: hypothetical protein VM260_17740 [Pirellula sp.]|nr:hypothetical protein [Pirellula sp.]